jgi:hypothetical protein
MLAAMLKKNMVGLSDELTSDQVLVSAHNLVGEMYFII